WQLHHRGCPRPNPYLHAERMTGASGDVMTFGAPGQDGTVVLGASGGSFTNAGPYTVFVQAGTLRPQTGPALLAVMLGSDAHTTTLSGATLDTGGQSFTMHDLQGGGHIGDSGAAATLTVNGGFFRRRHRRPVEPERERGGAADPVRQQHLYG